MDFRKIFLILFFIVLCSSCYAQKAIDIDLTDSVMTGIQNDELMFTNYFSFDNTGDATNALPIQIKSVNKDTNQETNVKFFTIPPMSVGQKEELPLITPLSCEPQYLKVEVDPKNTVSDYAGTKIYDFDLTYDWNSCRPFEASINLTSILFEDNQNHLEGNDIELYSYKDEFTMSLKFNSNIEGEFTLEIDNDNDFDLEYSDDLNFVIGTNKVDILVTDFEDLVYDELEKIKIKIIGEGIEEEFSYYFEFSDPVEIEGEAIIGNKEFPEINNLLGYANENLNLTFEFKREHSTKYYGNYIKLDLEELNLGIEVLDEFDITGNGKVKVKHTFKIPDINTGSYKIPYTVYLFDEYDNKILMEDSIKLRITERSHEIIINNVAVDVDCDNYPIVSFNLKNNGANNENIKLEIKSADLGYVIADSVSVASKMTFEYHKELDIFVNESARFLVKLEYSGESDYEAFTITNPCFIKQKVIENDIEENIDSTQTIEESSGIFNFTKIEDILNNNFKALNSTISKLKPLEFAIIILLVFLISLLSVTVIVIKRK